MPTKDALVDDLQAELEGGTDSALDSLFGAWVDEVYFRIASALDIVDDDVLTFDLAVTDVEVADVPLPTGIRQIEVVQLAGTPNTTLPFARRSALLTRGYDLDARGTPELWTWGAYDLTTNRRSIRLIPYPVATSIPVQLDLVGRRDPQALVGSAQVPLPPELVPALKDGVRAHWYQSENLVEQAGRYWQLYELAVDRAWRRMSNEPQPMGGLDPDADLKLLGRRPGLYLRVPPYILE